MLSTAHLAFSTTYGFESRNLGDDDHPMKMYVRVVAPEGQVPFNDRNFRILDPIRKARMNVYAIPQQASFFDEPPADLIQPLNGETCLSMIYYRSKCDS